MSTANICWGYLTLFAWVVLSSPTNLASSIRLGQNERREFYSKDLPKSHPFSGWLAQLCLAITINQGIKNSMEFFLKKEIPLLPLWVILLFPTPKSFFQIFIATLFLQWSLLNYFTSLSCGKEHYSPYRILFHSLSSHFCLYSFLEHNNCFHLPRDKVCSLHFFISLTFIVHLPYASRRAGPHN